MRRATWQYRHTHSYIRAPLQPLKEVTVNRYATAVRPIATVADLVDQVQRGQYGPAPETVHVTTACWIRQSTQFPETAQKYKNYYLLMRIGRAFGACAVERDQVDSVIAEDVAGQSVAMLLADARLPVRIAALDAYLGEVLPHRDAAEAQPLWLPLGTPYERAHVRDEAIASLLDLQPDQRVGLIGVVNPLVGAIRTRGAVCLPCDFNMEATQWGDPVTRDMEQVLDAADLVIATGMTLSNGSFDRILERVRQRAIPLIVYAQTGSSIAARFVGQGVTALSAEPFPFSQFSAEPTTLYRYRAAQTVGTTMIEEA